MGVQFFLIASRRAWSRSEVVLVCLNQILMGSGKAKVAQFRGAYLNKYWKEGNSGENAFVVEPR